MEIDFKSPVWERNGNLAAQRVHCGKVKAKLGRRMTVRLPAPLVKAMCAMMRCARRRVAWAWRQDRSFPAGLGVGKGGTKLSHGPGHAVPGTA